MLNIYKKSLLLMMISFLCIGIEAGFAFGYSITLNAIDDAGQYPGENAYLRFSGQSNIYPTEVWTTAQQVYGYASNNSIPSGWSLESAGNIWSDDLIVGESLLGLHAGTYRISPLDGAYQYDSFVWSDDPKDQKWRWEMHIQARNGQTINDYMLGSFDGFNTAVNAFNAASGSYYDINIAEGSELFFWIWDTNSIDNSGWLSAKITQIPEPSMILLLSIGLMALPGMRRLRA